MNILKKRIALILAAALVMTSVPLTERIASAEILPEITTDTERPEGSDAIYEAADTDTSVAADSLNPSAAAGGPDVTDDEAGKTDAKEPEYSEGDVIVCMAVDKDGGPVADDEITNDKAAEILSLLDCAEGLMDVTEAVKERDLYEPATEQGENGDDPVANDKALPGEDDEYELKFIHSDKNSTKQLIDMLEDAPGVLFVEPNYIYHLADEDPSVPYDVISIDDEVLANDETIADKLIGEDTDITRDGTTATSFDFTDKQYAYGNGPGGMDVPDWNDEGKKNAEGTVVAVLDSGVDYEHEDLKEVIWNDGLKYPELTALGGGMYGYNAVDKDISGKPYNSYDPMDDNEHGTHCAGSVGAPWNGIGVSGTANGTRIMAVKAMSADGSGYNKDLLKGLNYICAAKKAGVNVVAVNNSWGGIVRNNAFFFATLELEQLGVICCFAAGNEYLSNDHYYMTTTVTRENEGVISVAANDAFGQKCDFSNYGIRTVDVSAPGSYITSAFPRGKNEPDPDLCPPVSDVSGNKVRDIDLTTGSTYFTYNTLSEASLEYKEDWGRNVIAIGAGIKNGADFLSVKGPRLGERPKYLMLKDRFGESQEASKKFKVRIKVLLNNGNYCTINPGGFVKYWYTGGKYELICNDLLSRGKLQGATTNFILLF